MILHRTGVQAHPENVTSAIAIFNQQSRCTALVPDRFAKFWKG
jgi:hypothetical protein